MACVDLRDKNDHAMGQNRPNHSTSAPTRMGHRRRLRRPLPHLASSKTSATTTWSEAHLTEGDDVAWHTRSTRHAPCSADDVGKRVTVRGFACKGCVRYVGVLPRATDGIAVRPVSCMPYPVGVG